jgi:YHS domain-containing protein
MGADLVVKWGVMVLAALLSACCKTAAPAEGAAPATGADGPKPAAAEPRADGTVPPPADPAERVTCPVCGLEFPAGEARAAVTHAGRTYRFLLEDHADAFRRDPQRYLPADAGRAHSREQRQ